MNENGSVGFGGVMTEHGHWTASKSTHGTG